MQSKWEPSWERRYLSPIFGERWPLVYFVFPGRCICSLGGSEARFDVQGNHFVERRHLSPILGESGLQPIVCFQPATSIGEGFVTGSIALGNLFF